MSNKEDENEVRQVFGYDPADPEKSTIIRFVVDKNMKILGVINDSDPTNNLCSDCRQARNVTEHWDLGAHGYHRFVPSDPRGRSILRMSQAYRAWEFKQRIPLQYLEWLRQSAPSEEEFRRLFMDVFDNRHMALADKAWEEYDTHADDPGVKPSQLMEQVARESYDEACTLGFSGDIRAWRRAIIDAGNTHDRRHGRPRTDKNAE